MKSAPIPTPDSTASYRFSIARSKARYRAVAIGMILGGPWYAAYWYDQRRALMGARKRLFAWRYAKLSLSIALLSFLFWILTQETSGYTISTIVAVVMYGSLALAWIIPVFLVPFYGARFATRWNGQGFFRRMNPLLAFALGPWYIQPRINAEAIGPEPSHAVPHPKFRRRALVQWAIMIALVALLAIQFPAMQKQYYLATATDAQRAMAASIQATDDGLVALAQTNGQIVDAATFRDACIEGPTDSLELGCYYTVVEKLYVLDVQDPRLEAVEKSVTAHEILHHVYFRSTSAEKQRLDALTEAEAQKFAADPFFQYLTEPYKEESPEVYRDELHSLLSAMNAPLGPELEAHYAKYFNRTIVRDSHQVYYQALQEVEQEIESLEARLKSLEGQITAIDNRLTGYEARMDSLMARGDYDTYNALVPVFNNDVSRMKRLISEYETTYGRYEKILQSYTAIFEDIQLGKPSDIGSMLDKY